MKIHHQWKEVKLVQLRLILFPSLLQRSEFLMRAAQIVSHQARPLAKISL